MPFRRRNTDLPSESPYSFESVSFETVIKYGQFVDYLGDWSLDRPLDCGMAADMQCRLVKCLRHELAEHYTLTPECPTPALVDDRNYAQYKRPYIDAIADRIPADGRRLTQVHSEVTPRTRTVPTTNSMSCYPKAS